MGILSDYSTSQLLNLLATPTSGSSPQPAPPPESVQSGGDSPLLGIPRNVLDSALGITVTKEDRNSWPVQKEHVAKQWSSVPGATVTQEPRNVVETPEPVAEAPPPEDTQLLAEAGAPPPEDTQPLAEAGAPPPEGTQPVGPAGYVTVDVTSRDANAQLANNAEVLANDRAKLALQKGDIDAAEALAKQPELERSEAETRAVLEKKAADEEKYRKRVDAIYMEREAEVKAFASTSPDPDRMFSSSSNFTKMMTFALAGIGAQFGGGATANMLDKMIKDDLQKQQFAQNTKKDHIAMLGDQIGILGKMREDTAKSYDVQYATMTQMLADRLTVISAGFSDERAQNAALDTANELNMMKQAVLQGIAEKEANLQMKEQQMATSLAIESARISYKGGRGGGGGGSKDLSYGTWTTINDVPKELRGQVVHIPGGKWADARSAKNAEELNKMFIHTGNFVDRIDYLLTKDLENKIPGFAGKLKDMAFTNPELAEIYALVADLKVSYSLYKGQGVINKGDEEQYEKMMGVPETWTADAAAIMIKNLRNLRGQAVQGAERAWGQMMADNKVDNDTFYGKAPAAENQGTSKEVLNAGMIVVNSETGLPEEDSILTPKDQEASVHRYEEAAKKQYLGGKGKAGGDAELYFRKELTEGDGGLNATNEGIKYWTTKQEEFKKKGMKVELALVTKAIESLRGRKVSFKAAIGRSKERVVVIKKEDPDSQNKGKWPGHEEGWTPPKVREEKPAAKPSTEDDVKWPGRPGS